MNKRTIRLAVAADQKNKIKATHFGEADKYLIYEINDGIPLFQNEMINLHKNLDEEIEHGSVRKGSAIMELLKTAGVKVLVSRQFGKNIQIVNRFFIPVIVDSGEPEIVLDSIVRHIRWIEDELESNPGSYKLFILKKGIIKKGITGNQSFR